MKESLSQLVQSVLNDLNLSEIKVTITPTDDPIHGDYATNVAFQAAKKLGKSPLQAAELIGRELRVKSGEQFENIEVAAPGFINFTLSKRFLLQSLLHEHPSAGHSTLRDESSGSDSKSSGQESSIGQSGSSLKAKKIMIEFTDPNPFKEFHIGHLYSNIVGESISRLLEATGAEVKRVCYQGDVGLHVAKALYGMQKLMATSKWQIADLENKSLNERAKFLGQAYALGATAFEEDSTAKEEIITINKVVYASAGSAQVAKDESIWELYTKGRQWTLDYFETIYARLGTKFWHYYFESEAGPIGLDLVKKYLGKPFPSVNSGQAAQGKVIFKESDGAVVFPGEDHGLHTRVFINSLGLPTYEAKELGLAPTKYKDYPYDRSIIITGNEINEYFKVLLKALSIIYPDLAAKTFHLSHGMVRLPEGKMSSRTGNVKTGEWLLNEAVSRANDKIKETKVEDGGLSDAEKSQVSEMVGVGAVKWALLRSGIGKDVEFSFDESVSFEGNSGPYLQYTYVRTRSVLAKAGEGTFKMDSSKISLSNEERSLLVLLNQYSDIVLDAAEKYSPSTLTTYLFTLAQTFNLFYQKSPILKEKGDIRIFRLMLTLKVGDSIKEGLYLLGIQTPERM